MPLSVKKAPYSRGMPGAPRRYSSHDLRLIQTGKGDLACKHFPHEDAVAPDVGLGREDGEVEAPRRHPSRITGGWLRIYEDAVNEDAFYTDL